MAYTTRLLLNASTPASMVFRTAVVLVTLQAAVLSCSLARSQTPGVEPPQAAADSIEATAEPKGIPDPPGIHNLLKVSDRIYSGSEPHGEEGFASLAKLGVKTVVSVDGAKPNVELARRNGLRYVHIPIGYDGIPHTAGMSLARLMKEGTPPIYIHCHHGRHRGPAAAAVACIAGGDMENKPALQILVHAGTSKDYAGLWRDVAAYVPPAVGTKLPALVEIAEVGSFAAAMAQVDRAYDNLKLCRDAKWGVPPDHPDLVPAQEALLLQEGLREAGRNLADDEYDDQFKAWLTQAEAAAADLRSDLRAAKMTSASGRFALLENACKQCHKVYRDQ